jgi:hypothetical protein
MTTKYKSKTFNITNYDTSKAYDIYIREFFDSEKNLWLEYYKIIYVFQVINGSYVIFKEHHEEHIKYKLAKSAKDFDSNKENRLQNP